MSLNGRTHQALRLTSIVSNQRRGNNVILREGYWALRWPQGDSPAAQSRRVARPSLPNKTTGGDCRCSGIAEGMAGKRPTTKDRRSMDVETHMAEGGDGKARLLATEAGNRSVDCDEGRGAGRGPMSKGAGDGGSYRGGGVIDGKSGRSWRGGARKTEPERDEYGGGSEVTNAGGGCWGAWLMVAK